MPNPKLVAFREKHPEYQGMDDAQVLDFLANDKSKEKFGRAMNSAERADLYKAADVQTGNAFTGLGRGFVSGLNVIPDALARAISPDAADWLGSFDETRPGEGSWHTVGNLAGNVAGFMVPMGAVSKIGKVGKGLEAAEAAAAIAKAATPLNVALGAAQGAKEWNRRGSYYNGGSGVGVPLAGAALGGAMGAIPGFSSLTKAVLGNAAIGAASSGLENVLQFENGTRSGFDPLEVGAGAVAGGILGAGIHTIPGFVADKAKKVLAKPGPKVPVPPMETTAASPAAPSEDLLALLDRVRGANSAVQHPSGEAQASDLEFLNRLNAMKEEEASLQHALDIGDPKYYPSTRETYAQLPGSPNSQIFRVNYDTRLGPSGQTSLLDDSGAESFVDALDFLNRYRKSFKLPNSDHAVPIAPGYHPMQEILDDTIKGEPVQIVGHRPTKTKMNQKFLAIKKDDPATLLNPMEVSVADLERLYGQRLAERNAAVSADDVMREAGGIREEDPLRPVHTRDSLIAEIQARINALKAAQDAQAARRAARMGTR